jgi:hypothetical protein
LSNPGTALLGMETAGNLIEEIEMMRKKRKRKMKMKMKKEREDQREFGC